MASVAEPEVMIKEEIFDSDYDDPPTPVAQSSNLLRNPLSLQPRLAIRKNIFVNTAEATSPAFYPNELAEMAPVRQRQRLRTPDNFDGNIIQRPVENTKGSMEGVFLCYKGFKYYRDGTNFDKKTQCQKVYWRCSAYKRNRCRARLHTDLAGYVLRVSQAHLINCKLLYPRNG